MKNKIRFIILILAAAGSIWVLWKYWSKSSSDIDLIGVEKSVSIHHFDDAFFTSNTDDIHQTIETLETEFMPFFQSNTDVAFWQKQRLDEGQNQLYTDWKNQLKSYKDFDQKVERLFKHLYYFYPDYPELYAFTYISNLDFDFPIIIADQYLFIAVDLYLGPNHPAYQRDPAYLNQGRQKAFITRDISENLALQFATKNPEENTLLNEIIYWGKTLYFSKAMQPKLNDTALFKMSPPQLEFCLGNEQEMWNYFIQNELLFSSADDVKRKFIQPAPFSKFGMPFDAQTPGMVGRWIGLRIVESYMQSNPDVSLPQLMAEADTRKIFKLSKYKP